MNRGQDGTPKNAIIGGLTRSRLSTQSIKYAIRLLYLQEKGIRSRELSVFIDPLVELGHPVADVEKVVKAFVKLFFGKLNEKDESRLGAMVFISGQEHKDIINSLHENFDRAISELDSNGDILPKTKFYEDLAKKLTTQFSKFVSSIDLALFGRMMASNSDLQMDSSVFVADAISTHYSPAQPEWFTGMDDRAAQAGMLETTFFTSATFYFNFNVDWDQLVSNLGGNTQLARQGLAAFLKGSFLALPGGKKSSHFAHTEPGLLFVEIRDGEILTYANAFEASVKSEKGSGYMGPSAKAFAKHLPYAYRSIGKPLDAYGLIGSLPVEEALSGTILDPNPENDKEKKLNVHWKESIDDLVESIVERVTQ